MLRIKFETVFTPAQVATLKTEYDARRKQDASLKRTELQAMHSFRRSRLQELRTARYKQPKATTSAPRTATNAMPTQAQTIPNTEATQKQG